MHREAVTFLTLILEDFSYVFHTVRLLVIKYNPSDKAGRVPDHKMCPSVHVGGMMVEPLSKGPAAALLGICGVDANAAGEMRRFCHSD